MPKIQEDDELEEEENEMEDDEDTDWDTAPARTPRTARVETRGRKPKIKPEEPEVKRRFGLIGPQPIRIVDTETNELIGEGEFAVIQALTDVIERLERIEVQLGAITG